MMLADHAQVADGKLFISGGGWSACEPGATPCALAVILHVPWQETNEKVSFSLRLVDEDGRGIMQPGAQDGLPVQVNGHFEARRPPGMTPGAEINVPISFNIVLRWSRASATAGCSTLTGRPTIPGSFRSRHGKPRPNPGCDDNLRWRLADPEQAFEGATIRRAASRAGVDPSLVIQHYGSKAALFTAAIQLRQDTPAAAAEHVLDVLDLRAAGWWFTAIIDPATWEEPNGTGSS